MEILITGFISLAGNRHQGFRRLIFSENSLCGEIFHLVRTDSRRQNRQWETELNYSSDLILAASLKSPSVRPFSLCEKMVSFTFPQVRKMSG